MAQSRSASAAAPAMACSGRPPEVTISVALAVSTPVSGSMGIRATA
jgi:hypothetical protein